MLRILKFPDTDILHLNLDGDPTMELEPNQPAFLKVQLVLVDTNTEHPSVYHMNELIAIRYDGVVILVIALNRFFELFGISNRSDFLDQWLLGTFLIGPNDHHISALPHKHPAFFFKEHAGKAVAWWLTGIVFIDMPARFEIGLKPLHDIVVDHFGAVLNPGILSVDLILETEFEVTKLTPSVNEKGVSLRRIFRSRFADNGNIFNPPEFVDTVPMLKGLPVKERFEAVG